MKSRHRRAEGLTTAPRMARVAGPTPGCDPARRGTPAEWATPEKHAFTLYTREGTYKLKAKEVPDDVVGRLDCAILEREL